MDTEFDLQSVVVASRDQVSCEVGAESAILNLKNGVYYTLDPVGARIWSLLQEPRSVSEIHDAILGEYDVEPARCQSDLIALLARFADEGLIEIRGVAAS
jgi:hypothetical protein